jgi:cation diffusion facilitator CzcD-associated flavoprotein CzcO
MTSLPPNGLPDEAAFRGAIAAIDPIIALLSLVHLTGERQLLVRFGPELEGTAFGEGSTFMAEAGVARRTADAEIVAEIRERLAQRMLADPRPVLACPDPALFAEMAELCIGFPIAGATLDMAMEQAGFVTDQRSQTPAKVPPADFRVLIVGAGMIGINAAIKLQAAGFTYKIIEKREEIGGTWSINTYPNVAVDTPSAQYSYSFELNPSWSKYYPTGSEYLAYLEQVAERYGIAPHIDFKTEMVRCEWDAARQLWLVTARRGDDLHVYEANAVVTALGFLNRPSFPRAEGLDTFAGPVIHSAQWDPSVDYSGKRVALIGSGCTAVQVAAGLAGTVERLTIVQRQPNWVTPNPQVLQPVGEDERLALEHIPYVVQWTRLRSLATTLTDYTQLYKIDPDWHAEHGTVSAMNDGLRTMCLDYIARTFADRPDLAAKVTPDFPPFAKRPIADCGYYETLKRPDVDLVEGSLASLERDAVVLADGTRVPCDAVILATGFELDFLKGFEIVGRDGRTIEEAWSPYPFAYSISV